jgi:hypothetical protein
MKIKGLKNAKVRRERKFPIIVMDGGGEEQQIDLILRGMPFGFEREWNRELPLPEPPEKPKPKDKEGRIWKNPDGTPVTVEDPKDPKFLEAFEYMSGLRAVWLIKRAFDEDGTIQFESDPEKFKTTSEYYEACYKELEDIGFPAGTIIEISNVILELSGFDINKETKRARRFLSRKVG